MKNLCPKCLNVLPGDYPFDHVAIDRALAGDITVLKGMDLAERRELVRIARCSGMTDSAIAVLLRRSLAEVRGWLIDRKPHVRCAELDRAVRALYDAERLSDPAIAKRLGVGKNAVFCSRKRQNLPALYDASGLVKTAVTA